MRRNRKNKENQGITLIALIITVILLLILVGVSINLALKGNLFESTQKAVNGTNAKVDEQQPIIDELMNEWDEMEKDACSHNWKEGEILLQPTCTTTGKKQVVCEICGKLLEVEIPALGHNYENRVCTRCGETEPGCTTHTYGDWVITKSPTCIAEGSKKRTCTVCRVEKVETIPATGEHTYGDWVVTKQATCTAGGTVTRTCTVCGVEQVETTPVSHAYGDWVITKQATCTVSGSKTRTCTLCGAKEVLRIVPLGHTFVNNKCKVCGATLGGLEEY